MGHSYSIFCILFCLFFWTVTSAYKIPCTEITNDSCIVRDVFIINSRECLSIHTTLSIRIENSVLVFLNRDCDHAIDSDGFPQVFTNTTIHAPALYTSSSTFHMDASSIFYIQDASTQNPLHGYDGAGGSNLGIGGMCSKGTRASSVQDYADFPSPGGSSISSTVTVFGGGSQSIFVTKAENVEICGRISVNGGSRQAPKDIFRYISTRDSSLPFDMILQDSNALQACMLRLMIRYLPKHLEDFRYLYSYALRIMYLPNFTNKMITMLTDKYPISINPEEMATFGLEGRIPHLIDASTLNPIASLALYKADPVDDAIIYGGGAAGSLFIATYETDNDPLVSLCGTGSLFAVGGNGGPGGGGGSGGRIILKYMQMSPQDMKQSVYGGASDVDGKLLACECGSSGLVGYFQGDNAIRQLFMGSNYDQRPAVSSFTMVASMESIVMIRTVAYVTALFSKDISLYDSTVMKNTLVQGGIMTVSADNTVLLGEGTTQESPQLAISGIDFIMDVGSSLKATDYLSISADEATIRGQITNNVVSVDPSVTIVTKISITLEKAEITAFTIVLMSPIVSLNQSTIIAKAVFDGNWCSYSMRYPLCSQYDPNYSYFNMYTLNLSSPERTVLMMSKQLGLVDSTVTGAAIGLCSENMVFIDSTISSAGLGCPVKKGQGSPNNKNLVHVVQGGSFATYGGLADDPKLLYGSLPGSEVGSGGSSTAAGGYVFLAAYASQVANNSLISAKGVDGKTQEQNVGAGSGGSISLVQRRLDVHQLVLDLSGGSARAEPGTEMSAGGSGGIQHVEYTFGLPPSHTGDDSFSIVDGGNAKFPGSAGWAVTSPRCPAGTADFLCTECAAGKYSDASGAIKCEECPIGSSSPPQSAACTQCVPGTYAAVPGSTTCESCPIGTFSSTTGQHVCAPCELNTYANERGSLSCKTCAVNSFSDNGIQCKTCPYSTERKATQTECTPCVVQAPSGGKYEAVGCKQVCIPGRVGDKCLYPFESVFQDIDYAIIFGILAAAIVFTYIPASIHYLWTYKRGQQTHSLSLQPGDLERHMVRVMFTGYNTPSQPLHLRVIADEYVQPFVLKSTYTKFAETINLKLAWNRNENLILQFLWLCPPLRLVYLRSRQYIKVLSAAKALSRADAILSDPKASALGNCVRVGYSGCYSFLWIDQLRPDIELGQNTSMYPKSLPLAMPSSLYNNAEYMQQDSLFHYFEQEVGEAFATKKLHEILYNSSGTARIDALSRFCKHMNAWSLSQPTKHYVGHKAAYIAMNLVTPMEPTEDYVSVLNVNSKNSFEEKLLENKQRKVSKKEKEPTLRMFQYFYMETLVEDAQESSDEEEHPSSDKAADASSMKIPLHSTNGSLSDDMVSTNHNSVNMSMPMSQRGFMDDTVLSPFKFTPVTDKSLARDFSYSSANDSLTPQRLFSPSNNNALVFTSEILGRIELTVDPALSAYAEIQDNPKRKDLHSSTNNTNGAISFQEVNEIGNKPAQDVWNRILPHKTRGTRLYQIQGLNCGVSTIPLTLISCVLLIVTMMQLCAEVFLTLGVVLLLVVFCCPPLTLPLLPFLMTHACISRNTAAARVALFTAYSATIQSLVSLFVIVISVLLGKLGSLALVFPFSLIVALFLCIICLESLVQYLDLQTANQLKKASLEEEEEEED